MFDTLTTETSVFSQPTPTIVMKPKEDIKSEDKYSALRLFLEETEKEDISPKSLPIIDPVITNNKHNNLVDQTPKSFSSSTFSNFEAFILYWWQGLL